MNEVIKFTRGQLYNELWQTSLTSISKKYNIDYSKLKNICIEYNIPLPSKSYWGKKNMKLDVSNEVIPLPQFDKEEIEIPLKTNVHISTSSDNENNKDINEYKILDFLDDKEKEQVIKAISELNIAKYKKNHKVIIRYNNKIIEEKRKQTQERRDNYLNPYYHVQENIETGYFSNISKNQKIRAMKILSAIYFTIEQLGGKINEDFSMSIRDEVISMQIEELKDQVPHELTKDEAKKLLEYEDNKKRNNYAYKPNIKKYDYVYDGKLKITFEIRNYIKETDKLKLEDRLGDIIIKLYQISEITRIERKKLEEQRRKEEEERKIRTDFNNRKKEEAIRTIKLINNADDYQLASKIRNYINAIESEGNLDEETKEWIKWANKKANWIDPTINEIDELLGIRNHEKSEEDKNEELDECTSYYDWY